MTSNLAFIGTFYHPFFWGGGLLFLAFPVIFLVIVLLLARFWRRPWHHGSAWHQPTTYTPSPDDPQTILSQRFARGEIDATEYQERLNVLLSHKK